MKRLLAIFLCAFMLMAIMPMSLAQNLKGIKIQERSAEDNNVPQSGNKAVIDKIEINAADITPIAGDLAGDHLAYTLPSDANYTCVDHIWFDDTNSLRFENDEQFVSGNMYSTGWIIKAASGYVFDENTAVTINGSDAVVDMYNTEISTDDNTIFYVWTKAVLAEEAHEDIVISNITINDADITPIAGDLAGDHLAYTIPSDANYTCTDHHWYDDTNGDEVSSDQAFESGYEYSTGWVIKAASGYVFDENTAVTINGSDTVVDTYYTEISSADNTIFYVWTKAVLAEEVHEDIVISNITINDADITPIAGDLAGDHLAYTIPSDANYTCTDHYWFDDTNDHSIENDEAFESGYEYSLFWRIKAASGYVFDENTKVTINGSDAVVDTEWTWVVEDDNTIFYVWTKPVLVGMGSTDIVIPSIDITNADITPIIGDLAGDHLAYTFPSDANYTCTEHYWFDDTNVDLFENDEAFESGYEYSLYWGIKASSGYVFDENTKVTINGSDAVVDTEWTCVDEDDNTIFYVWTKPVEAIEPSSQHTVTFVDGVTGETISTIAVEHGNDAELPTAPEHEGYIFKGWDNDGKNIVADITITAQYLLLGDTNFDGTVNTGDAVMILRSCVGLVEFSDDQKLAADMSGDGKINTGDAVAVLRFYVGLKDA